MKLFVFKCVFFIQIFVCLEFNAQQNLLPNPGFEFDTGCPTSLSQIYKLQDWFCSNATPDYFNKCSSVMSIPSNFFGFQDVSQNCHSYIGIVAYVGPFGTTENINNEIIAVKLNDSLIKNVKYFLSFKVSLSNKSKYTINNLGAFFSSNYPNVTNTVVPSNYSQINFNQYVTDTLNWVSLKSSFVADSNYKYISIGNFYDTLNTQLNIYNLSGIDYSYFYIDDVCLSDDSLYSYNYVYNFYINAVKSEPSTYENILISPNPSSNKINIRINNNDFFDIKIFDSYGEVIFSEEKLFQEIEISTEIYLNGVYYIQIRKRNDFFYKKLIIQK